MLKAGKGKIIFTLVERAEQSIGLLVIPETVAEEIGEGIVVSSGDDAYHKKNRVLFTKKHAIELSFEGKVFYSIKAEFIHAKVVVD